MTEDELFRFTCRIDTEIVQAPNDLDESQGGTIHRKLNEFMEKNGPGWILQRAPMILEDGSLLAILIRLDPDLEINQ